MVQNGAFWCKNGAKMEHFGVKSTENGAFWCKNGAFWSKNGVK
jgi:hypothetical protein